ncbi:MAG: phenylacetate-CoA oxygenase/reductase subunit PaaK [Chitinophagaceae bacterium]|nr:phenylacetate-CoA oxygenase/reductase subunit PaaK [Chitinophagaceae bacterium]
MALHFHTLTIADIKKETEDCISIALAVPENLKEIFQFTHGQNITLKTNIDGEEIRRSYSICSAPFDGELRVAVKKVMGGKFSIFANEKLKKGDTIEVLAPSGKFNTALSRQNKKNYLAIAAGSGITPILSIIKTTLATELESTFTLIFGNRSRSNIIFFEALEAIKNKYLQRFNFINILSREKIEASINFGRINTEKLTELKKVINYKNIHEAFICGPEEMIFSSKDFLLQEGMDIKNIHFELFTTPGVKKITGNSGAMIGKGAGPVSNITIKLDGRSLDFDLSFSGNSILDEALQQGADLPYACKGGVCSTCRAKLLEGKVEMDVNYALEPEEVAQGFILTCQAHPVTDKVVVDFDVR